MRQSSELFFPLPEAHRAVYPPSVSRVWPVTYADPAEQSQIIAVAISSGSAIRPIGCAAVADSRRPSLRLTPRRNMSVSTPAGATQLIRIPELAYSSANDFVNPI